jgi:tricorn protease
VFGGFYYGRDNDRKTALKVYTSGGAQDTTIATDVNGYELSQDGKKVLLSSAKIYQLLDATPTGGGSKKTVSTAGLAVDRVPAQEWAQIFDEVWRRYRDYFYVKNMHGYDWEGLRNRYRPLLQYVAHRSDLNYVIAEMIAELSVQHAYISGGDWERPPRPRVALPGARFAVDSATGLYRIAKIFGGQNEEQNYRSPLTEIGVNAAVGDYVLKIDGRAADGTDRSLSASPQQGGSPGDPDAEPSRQGRFGSPGDLRAGQRRVGPHVSRDGPAEPEAG